MREQLSLIDRMQSLFALHFNYNSTLDHQISPETAIQLNPLVDQGNSGLPLDPETEFLHLISYAGLISGLEKARLQFSMNLDRRTDDFI